MDRKFIIPNFNSKNMIIHKDSEKALYLIGNILNSVSGESIFFDEDRLSLITTLAKYGHDKTGTTEYLNTKANALFVKHFPDGNIIIEVTSDDIGEGKYKLIITLRVHSNDILDMDINSFDIYIDSDKETYGINNRIRSYR